MMFPGEIDDLWDPLAPKVPICAQGMSILLVDRDTTSLMFMSSILEAYSYKVTTIEILSIAMAIYEDRKGEFDAIMANVHVNNKPDLELVREIIKKKKTPIILMSSMSPEVLKKEGQLEGACLFWEKPLSNTQLRGVWQHVYRFRIEKGGHGKKIIYGGNENKGLKKVVEEPIARKCAGIQIGEGGSGCRTTRGNDFQASDGGKRKNNQVVPGTEIEPLRTMAAADQNQRNGYRKKANYDDDDDNKGGSRRRQRRIFTPNHFPFRAWTGKNKSGRSYLGKPGLRWTKELHFKFTAAISKLGEKKATPRAIQELMNVCNLSRRQIAEQLEKYKARVQLIMDSCRDTPSWVPPSRNVAPANVTGRAPLQPPPPVSPQQPAGSRSRDYGHGIGGHQGSIRIRERPPLPTPITFTTNANEKGKQALDFPGRINTPTTTSPYLPLPHYRQNQPPTPTFTRLSNDQQQQHSKAGAISNLPPATAGTTVAGAHSSANPNIPGDWPTSYDDGFDESDDLAFLTEWLSKSLKADEGDYLTFDWMDTDMNMP